MGYEVLVRWMLMVGAELGRRFQSARRRLISEIEVFWRLLAGQNEYLPSMPVSIADPLQRLMFGCRQPRRGGERILPGVTSYPDDLFGFQARRLALS